MTAPRTSRIAIFFFISLALFATANALPVDVKRINKPTALYEIPRKNLYALGIATAPFGLVTIINGNIYVARPNIQTATETAGRECKIAVDNSFKTVADKLAYVAVRSWLEVPLSKEVRSEAAFAVEFMAALKKLGFENARGIPFLLKGQFRKIELEVGSELVGVKQTETNPKGVIFGLFTKETSSPRVSFVWHFVDEQFAKAGAIRQLEFDDRNPVTLFLPR